MALQLGGAWLLGSALMGTIALLFLTAANAVIRLPSGITVSPGCPVPARGAGFVMVAGHSPAYPGNVFSVYAEYARAFFSGPPAVLY